MTNEEVLKIYAVKTDDGFFMTDTLETDGYHRTKLKDLLFDGEQPKPTFARNWYKVSNEPESVQKQMADKRINIRYELDDPHMESPALPLVIEDLDDEDARYNLYSQKYDVEKGGLKDFPVDIEIVTEVENFRLPPKVNYEMSKVRHGSKGVLENTDIHHQLLDKMIIPEVVLHEYPCKLSSVQMYRIIRQHIQENIDNHVAKITSDYDFCFTVKKRVPRTKPVPPTHEQISSGNLMKNKFRISDYEEHEIFEMTNNKDNYKSYTPISEFTANNQHELTDKLDKYLSDLMEYINEPLVQCECCAGLGWKSSQIDIDEIKLK